MCVVFRGKIIAAISQKSYYRARNGVVTPIMHTRWRGIKAMSEVYDICVSAAIYQFYMYFIRGIYY